MIFQLFDRRDVIKVNDPSTSVVPSNSVLKTWSLVINRSGKWVNCLQTTCGRQWILDRLKTCFPSHQLCWPLHRQGVSNPDHPCCPLHVTFIYVFEYLSSVYFLGIYTSILCLSSDSFLGSPSSPTSRRKFFSLSLPERLLLDKLTSGQSIWSPGVKSPMFGHYQVRTILGPVCRRPLCRFEVDGHVGEG